MSETDRCPECQGYRGLPRMVDMTSDNPHECSNGFHKEAPVADVAEVIEFPQANTAPVQEGTGSAPAPQEQAGLPVVGNPICPYCGESHGINGKMTRLGPFQVMVIMCRNPNCRKVLGAFQAFEMQLVATPGGPPN